MFELMIFIIGLVAGYVLAGLLLRALRCDDEDTIRPKDHTITDFYETEV